MRSIGDPYPPSSSATLVAAVRTRASKKINPTSGLQAQLHEQAGPGTRSCHGRRTSDLFQSGTDRRVPFRYGPDAPRLDAAFVAQLLGQLMPDREPGHTRRLAAYEDTPSSAQVFDTRL